MLTWKLPSLERTQKKNLQIRNESFNVEGGKKQGDRIFKDKAGLEVCKEREPVGTSISQLALPFTASFLFTGSS